MPIHFYFSGVIHAAYQCPSLEEFDVSGCEELTNGALDGFMEARCNTEDNRLLQITVGGKVYAWSPAPREALKIDYVM